MSRSERERREAERAARRATRLADRAEQRAMRKDEQAIRTSERADELAQRAVRRQSPRERQMDRSIEDFVDDVAEKWSRKAEEWVDEKSRGLFSEEPDYDVDDLDDGYSSEVSDRGSAEAEARKARRAADRARRTAKKATEFANKRSSQEFRTGRRSGQGKPARRRGSYGSTGSKQWGRRSWRRHGYGLYRDDKNKKICGVCAGSAEYLGVETWQVRLGALCGLFFFGGVAVPVYFVIYFLMDKKPYYREVTDRFERNAETQEEHPPMRRSMRERKSENRDNQSRVSSEQAFSRVKKKFANIENRLRMMESHVTSSKFELHREFKKISGEEQ